MMIVLLNEIMIALLNEIMIALFNSVSVHISMPFNRLHELFMLLLRLGMGQHIEVGVVVREYT